MAYRLNPTWCATASFAYPDPTQVLRVGDLAFLLTVMGHLSTRAPDSRNVDAFEENLRDSVRATRVDVERFDIEVSIPQVRHDLTMRTRANVVASAERLLTIRNCGDRVFEAVLVGENAIVFRLALGAGALRAHPYFAQRVTRLPIRRAGNAAYADRAFTIVDPVLANGFAGPSSVLPYMRLRTWLTSPCRDGLPHLSSYTYDEVGHLRIRLPNAQIAERLGVDMARGTASYIRSTLDRVSRDMLRADIDMRFHPARPRANAVLEAVIASAVSHTMEDERDVGETRFTDPVYPKPPSHIRFAKLAEPAPVDPIVITPPTPEPEAEPEEGDVDRPPFRSRPGRLHLRLVPTDPVEPTPSAPVTSSHVTSSDDVETVEDGDEYEWTDQDDEDEARDDHVYAPVPKAAAAAPVEPVEASSSSDEPVYDAEGFEIPVDKRPHRRPVYDVDGFDQHGYDRGGYGRDGAHWLTGLLVDEVSAGIKKPGVRGTVTVLGAPPTDRDRWTKSWVHPFQPPVETPHWSPKAALWLSVTEDESHGLHRFPLMVWQAHNRHDVVEWRLDAATRSPVCHRETVAVEVADWPEILAYRADLRTWAAERPTNLGDLPPGFVVPVERIEDWPWIMSHCVRDRTD